MSNTKLTRLLFQMNATLQEDLKELTAPTKRKFSFGAIFKQVRMLFCDVKHCRVTYRLILLFLCTSNVYYVAIYNASQLKGDPIKNMIMFGFAEVLGISFGDRL